MSVEKHKIVAVVIGALVLAVGLGLVMRKSSQQELPSVAQAGAHPSSDISVTKEPGSEQARSVSSKIRTVKKGPIYPSVKAIPPRAVNNSSRDWATGRFRIIPSTSGTIILEAEGGARLEALLSEVSYTTCAFDRSARCVEVRGSQVLATDNLKKLVPDPAANPTMRFPGVQHVHAPQVRQRLPGATR